jgi:hypothetical protein
MAYSADHGVAGRFHESSQFSLGKPSQSPTLKALMSLGKAKTAHRLRIHNSTRPMNTLYRCRLTERINGQRLIIHDVKDGVQLCNLQHVVNFTREIQQL